MRTRPSLRRTVQLVMPIIIHNTLIGGIIGTAIVAALHLEGLL